MIISEGINTVHHLRGDKQCWLWGGSKIISEGINTVYISEGINTVDPGGGLMIVSEGSTLLILGGRSMIISKGINTVDHPLLILGRGGLTIISEGINTVHHLRGDQHCWSYGVDWWSSQRDKHWASTVDPGGVLYMYTLSRTMWSMCPWHAVWSMGWPLVRIMQWTVTIIKNNLLYFIGYLLYHLLIADT